MTDTPRPTPGWLECIRSQWELGRYSPHTPVIGALFAEIAALQAENAAMRAGVDAVIAARVAAIAPAGPAGRNTDVIYDCGYCDGGYTRAQLARDLGLHP